MSNGRRTVVLGAIAGTSLLVVRRSFGARKEDLNQKTAEAIANNREKAEALLAEATRLGDKIDNVAAKEIWKKEATLYTELSAILRKQKYDLSAYVIPTYAALAKATEANGIALVFPQLFYTFEQALELFQRPPGPCRETVVTVLVDMFLEALRLRDVGELVQKIVAATPSLREKIDRLSHALGLRDWKQATDLIKGILEIFGQIAEGKLIVKGIELATLNRVKIEILRCFALRFVSFVGNVYTAISVAVVIYNNASRLVDAVRCDSK